MGAVMSTTLERGSRWKLRNKKLIIALQSIGNEKNIFSSAEVAKITGDRAMRIGSILRFTNGVQYVSKGHWQFTGEMLEVQA
jgi:hypothetical protein